jgi:hypothetical protein
MRWASILSPAQRAAILDRAERTARARPDSSAVPLARAYALEGAGEQGSALDRLETACSRFPADEAVHSAFHETAPSSSDSTRISPAFDISREA